MNPTQAHLICIRESKTLEEYKANKGITTHEETTIALGLDTVLLLSETLKEANRILKLKEQNENKTNT